MSKTVYDYMDWPEIEAVVYGEETDVYKRQEYIRHTITAVEPKVDTIRPEDVDTAAQMIAAAKKPFIFVGGGAVIADASEEVRALAHKIQAPVCDSLMGKGAFSGEDELYTGPVGMHGTKTSNYAMCELSLIHI